MPPGCASPNLARGTVVTRHGKLARRRNTMRHPTDPRPAIRPHHPVRSHPLAGGVQPQTAVASSRRDPSGSIPALLRAARRPPVIAVANAPARPHILQQRCQPTPGSRETPRLWNSPPATSPTPPRRNGTPCGTRPAASPPTPTRTSPPTPSSSRRPTSRASCTWATPSTTRSRTRSSAGGAWRATTPCGCPAPTTPASPRRTWWSAPC